MPFDDADDHVVIWTAWASREHYERWLAGPAYEDMLREVSGLVAEEPRMPSLPRYRAVQ